MKEILKRTGKLSLRVSWMLMKIYIPLSFVTLALKQAGFFEWISPILNPIMQFIGLPGKAAITLVASWLGSVYAGIATIPALNLSFREITILGIVIGFSHNLIVETGILMKLKFVKLRFPLFRISIALIAGFIMNHVLPEKVNGAILNPYSDPASFSWITAAKGVGITCLQIILIIFILNFFFELLKRWQLGHWLKKQLQPIASFMGLGTGALVPWMAGFVFGIVYGAGILFQFTEKKALSHKDACLVTVFIVLAHAIIEDTMVFVVIGGNFWWIILTRVLLAFIVMKLLSPGNTYKKFLWIGLAENYQQQTPDLQH